MKKFKLKIISPKEVVFDKMVRQITFKTTNGMRGILPDHIPFMAPLIPHILKITIEENKIIEFFSVVNGFIKFINNECIVITNESYNIKNISKEKIEQEIEYWENQKKKEKESKIHAKQAEIQLQRLSKITEKWNL